MHSNDVSELYPRIIFFGKDSRLILAFSGDPSQSNYNNLEVINFNEKESSFEFSQINFYPDKKKAVFDTDQSKCKGCHRATLRPNWESYDLWPGIYASEQESSISVGSPEDHAFRSFLAAQKEKNGVYAYIPGLANITHIDDLNDQANPSFYNERIRLLRSVRAKTNYDGKADHYFISHLSNNQRNNNAISVSISKLNFKRIFRLIQSNEKFNRYKYALFAAAANCSNIETFVTRQDHSLFDSKFKKTYAQLLEETRTANKTYVFKKFKRQGEVNRSVDDVPLGEPEGSRFTSKNAVNGFAPETVEPLAKLRYVMLLQDQDIEDWFMPFERNSFQFDFNAGLHGPLISLLANAATENDAELANATHNYMTSKPSHADSDLLSYKEYVAKDETEPTFCLLLREKSLASLGGKSNPALPDCDPDLSPTANPNEKMIKQIGNDIDKVRQYNARK